MGLDAETERFFGTRSVCANNFLIYFGKFRDWYLAITLATPSFSYLPTCSQYLDRDLSKIKLRRGENHMFQHLQVNFAYISDFVDD